MHYSHRSRVEIFFAKNSQVIFIGALALTISIRSGMDKLFNMAENFSSKTQLQPNLTSCLSPILWDIYSFSFEEMALMTSSNK